MFDKQLESFQNKLGDMAESISRLRDQCHSRDAIEKLGEVLEWIEGAQLEMDSVIEIDETEEDDQ